MLAVVIFLMSVMAHVNAQGVCRTQQLEEGLCVPALACETMREILNAAPRPVPIRSIELVRGSTCGSFDDVPTVCCALNRVSRGSRAVGTVNTTAIESWNGTKSVGISDTDIQFGMAVLEEQKCGYANTRNNRISHGGTTALSEFPWLALLVYADGLDRTLGCGGSLITDRYVLTAAHCIVVPNKKLVSVRLGEHDLNEEVDCIGRNQRRRCAPPIQEIDIEGAVYHKDYSRSRISNDIGLIRLITSAIFRSNVKPICLPTVALQSETFSSSHLIVAGWGIIENGLKANIPQKRVIPVKDIDYSKQTSTSIQIPDKQLCTGDRKNTDACKGDSGGAIFFPASDRKSAQYIQCGIIPAGSVLCDSNYNGAYVKVLPHLDWIAGNIKP